MRLLVPTLSVLALSGCAFVSSQDVADQKAQFIGDDTGDTDTDTDDCTLVSGYADGDGDGVGIGDAVEHCEGEAGFVSETGDCDDSDATALPGGTEVCDGADNDCNGTVDDNPTDGTVVYVDNDLDGYGTGDAVTLCDTTGHADNALDCDDNKLAVNPDATETCNELDDDCNGQVDDDAQGASTWYLDSDSDGFGDDATAVTACDPPDIFHTDVGGDCDDTAVDTNPAAQEQCDSIDHNCSGEPDETEPTWFVDDDGDGFGEIGGITQTGCAQPTGYAPNERDCDDSDAAVKPGASEVCDGADNDCDGLTDDADPSVGGEPTWYADADDDGFGDSTTPMTQCAQPTGFVSDNTDCVDTNPAVNPGETELCNGVDDDCANGIDDGIVYVDWYLDTDGDGYGDPGSTPVNDCATQSGRASNNTDCDDSDQDINPSETEVCNDIDDDCTGGADNGLATNDYWPDTDGDGYGDDQASPTNDCAQPTGFVTNNEDCDDSTNAVSPVDAEVCNGIDDDCSGVPDDGLPGTTYYVDGDSDGQGSDGDSGTEFCQDPGAGWSTNDTDCDDGDNTEYLGATEICDGNDTDCDGSLTDQPGWQTWYADTDTDTWGDDASTVDDCAAPASHVDKGGDCDDTDTDINPDETEVCGDGEDNDCSGTPDDGCAYLDCVDVIESGDSVGDGNYDIDPDGAGPEPTRSLWCDMSNGGWTEVWCDTMDPPDGWSASETTNCGTWGTILGGYNSTGNSQNVDNAVDTFGITHTRARFDFDFYYLDDWESETGNLYLEGAPIWSQGAPLDSGNQCGGAWSDGARQGQSAQADHSTDTLNIRFRTSFDGGYTNESWGADNFCAYVWRPPSTWIGVDSGDPADDCQQIHDNSQPSGVYWIDPDGASGVAAFETYCENDEAGGGWTLNFQQRGGTNTISGRSDLNDFIQNRTGSPGSMAYGDSFSIGASNTPAHTEYMVLFYDSSLNHDSDDSYRIATAANLFPDDDDGHSTNVTSVCSLDESTCDTTNVVFRYMGRGYFGPGGQTTCDDPYVESGTYAGQFGYCHDGTSSVYLTSSLIGNRGGFDEVKVWNYNGKAGDSYMLRVFTR